MGGIVVGAGLVVIVLGLVDMVTNVDYGIVSDIIGVIGLLVIGGLLVAVGGWLLWWGQRLETDKYNKKSTDRITPPATKLNRRDEVVDTDWTTLTKSRAHWHEDDH